MLEVVYKGNLYINNGPIILDNLIKSVDEPKIDVGK